MRLITIFNMVEKIENISPENIDTRVSYSKDEIKIETVFPETIQIPSYEYGNWQQELDYNIAIRNWPSSNFKLVRNSLSAVATTYNVWFTPKIVIVNGMQPVTDLCWCRGFVDATSESCHSSTANWRSTQVLWYAVSLSNSFNLTNWSIAIVDWGFRWTPFSYGIIGDFVMECYG